MLLSACVKKAIVLSVCEKATLIRLLRNAVQGLFTKAQTGCRGAEVSRAGMHGGVPMAPGPQGLGENYWNLMRSLVWRGELGG